MPISIKSKIKKEEQKTKPPFKVLSDVQSGAVRSPLFLNYNHKEKEQQ